MLLLHCKYFLKLQNHTSKCSYCYSNTLVLWLLLLSLVYIYVVYLQVYIELYQGTQENFNVIRK